MVHQTRFGDGRRFALAARGGRTDVVVGLELSDLSFSPWQAWYTSDTVLHGGQFF
jgi:hypothetical protein